MALYEAKTNGNEASLGKVLYLINYKHSEHAYSLAPKAVEQFYDDLANALTAEELLAAAEAHGYRGSPMARPDADGRSSAPGRSPAHAPELAHRSGSGS